MDRTKEEIIKDLDIQDGDKFLFIKISTDGTIRRTIDKLTSFEAIALLEIIKMDVMRDKYGQKPV